MYHMRRACPAHGGELISLTTSTDARPNPIIVSYGGDDVIQVWKLNIRGKKEIALKNMRSIIPFNPPTCMAIMDTRLCLAIETYHQIVVYKLEEENPSLANSYGRELKPIVHQHEDDHDGNVLAVAASPCLPLFVSSGRDGKVKVWDKDNQLIADIHFGSDLEAVCFADNRGDLLVGFQNQICLVKAELFLPLEYQYMGAIASGEYLGEHVSYNDLPDKPIKFDVDLEFWLVTIDSH